MGKNTKLNKRMQLYLQWPLYMILLLAVTNIIVFIMNYRAGFILLLFSIIYIVVSVTVYSFNKKRITRNLIEFSERFNSVEKKMFEEFSYPCVLVEKSGALLWSNSAFLGVASIVTNNPKNIMQVFPKITKELLQKKELQRSIEFHFLERYYRAELRKIDMAKLENSISYENKEDENEVIFITFQDDTELNKCMKEIREEKLVAAWIYLDNYDEALERVDEAKQALFAALIDRKISKNISNMQGIIKKIEKDKYFVIFKQKFMERLEKEKFAILEDVKSVNIGNDMPITLSIGIGSNGSSYAQNAEYARIAVDLALGRGGDQVVIKSKDDIFYYGGKTKSFEKNTKVKARVKAQALREIMGSRDKVIVMGHQISDVDSFGAAIGIYCAARLLKKETHIVINDITISIRNLMNCYTDTKQYPADLFVNNNEAMEIIDANTTLVVVDVNKPSYTECSQLLKKTKTIVVFDHHRQGKEVIENAVLSYIEPYASSACEMVAEILQYFSDEIKLKNSEADCIYAGIMIDTNNFMSKTGVRTFEAAAYLRRCGADVTRVRKLFRNDMTAYKARAEAVRNAIVYKDTFAISVCPSENVDSPTVVGAQAANELLNIIGIKASIVFTEYKNKIYVSSRSIDEINVQVIMEKLGGGGHMNIAGVQFPNCSLEEAKQRVYAVIDKMMEEGDL